MNIWISFEVARVLFIWFWDWLRENSDKASGAGIALVLVFISLALPSCRSIPYNNAHTSATSDSIIAVQQSLIERQRSDYSALYEEFNALQEEYSKSQLSSNSDETIIEKYDSSGILRERTINNKMSLNISELQSAKSILEQTNNSLTIENEKYVQTIDSLKSELHRQESIMTETIVEKKVIPSWCWYLLAADMILLIYIAFMILRKLRIIKI